MNAAVENGVDIGQGTAVEDREFEVVELDDDVVDSHADEGGKKMLRGGDQYALAHEAGGVADLGDVATDGGDFEVVEVGAAKDNAGTGRSRQEAHGNGCAGMQTDSREGERFSERLLHVGRV